MLYLFYSDKDFLIDKEIKKITKDYNELELVRYDFNNTNIDTIIDDASTISMFGDKKIIIVDNALMFTTAKFDNDLLEKYLKNYNPNTILIFIVNDNKIDSRKKITKLIKEKGIIKDFSEKIDLKLFVKNSFDDYNINDCNIQLLIDRVGNNFFCLENEINKIKIYKSEDKNITENDILLLTQKTAFEDVFKLIDYIVSNNKEKALEIYQEMKIRGEEDIKLIIMLANQFRILYQTKQLLKKGFREKEIAESLKIHPYRVKLAIGKCKSFSDDILLNYLSDLFDIDYGIKSGKINKENILELFILKN